MLRVFAIHRLILVIATLSACATAVAPPPAARAERLSGANVQALDDMLQKAVPEHGIVGYSLGILLNGQLVHRREGGFANFEHRVPITERSRYQIYSASKLFFNMAFMQLIENGQVDPDANLGRYLSNIPETWSSLTIRQTWSHMTGTTDILDLRGMEPTEGEALASVANIPLTFVPGTQTAYNQTNFLLLKMVYEKVTGIPYRDALRNRILGPVGLENVPLGDLSLVAPDLTTNYEAHGFEEGNLGRRSIKFPPYVYTSAGINITLDEFITWWQAVLDERFVRKATLDKFWEPVFRADGTPSYRSHGWERLHENGVLRIGHGGGARIHLFHYIPDDRPEMSVTVIFLNNGGRAFFDHRQLGDDLARIVLSSTDLH